MVFPLFFIFVKTSIYCLISCHFVLLFFWLMLYVFFLHHKTKHLDYVIAAEDFRVFYY